MREFLKARSHMVLVIIVVFVALFFGAYFLASFGMCSNACNISASSCNPVSCVLDGCMGCTECAGCILGCE